MRKELANNGYRRTDTTVHKCLYHVVFCPKYRRSVLTPPIKKRFMEVAASVADENNFGILEMSVAPDHVHLLLNVDPAIGVTKVVSRIKGRTANVLRKEFPELRTKLPTLWTRSKFVSTVGSVSLDTVKAYIEDQKGI